MEQIYINITSIEWWFTGVFFVIIGVILNWVIKFAPQTFKKFARNNKARSLKKLRSIRLVPIGN